MSGFKIHFRLKELDDIVPWGQEPYRSLHWFGMTDSLLWIDAGESTVYEYSDAARRQWGGERYNDYQLSRFLEDFSDTFRYVRESVPQKYYDMAERFRHTAYEWECMHIDDSEEEDDAFWRFMEEEYEPLTDWHWQRRFDSGHLVGGPVIGCFRCGEKLKFCWESDYLPENGSSIWTAPSGVYEMPYSEFVSEVRAFYIAFFEAMDRQVTLALQKDWGDVAVDKAYLAKEHAERKAGFFACMDWLSRPCAPDEQTDWGRVDRIFDKMQQEIGGTL